ncbi:MAG: pilin [Candidatus Paceibacterota bacterium]
MFIKKKKELLILAIFYCLFSYGAVFALEVTFPKIGELTLSSDSNIPNTVEYFYNVGIAIGTLVAVVMIIISGITIFLSRGEPAKISDAKKRMIGAIFGIIILGGSYLIIYVINSKIFEIQEPEERTSNSDDISGVYLKKSSGESILLTVATPNLTAQNFNEKATDFEIKYPSESEIKYGAIFFSGTDYKGQCYYSGSKGTESGTAPFSISSVYVFKTTGKDGTAVKIINNDNGSCQELSETKHGFYPKTTEISSYGTPFKLVNEDDGHWIETGSIILDDKTLVLIETRNKENCTETESEDGDDSSPCNCQVIRKTGNETCYPLKYDYSYNPDSVDTIKPGYVSVFQLY